MRNLWLIMVGLGLLINAAVANTDNKQEKSVINMFNMLTTPTGYVEDFNEARLQNMNADLKQLAAKFIVEEATEHEDQQIKGLRYVIKNIDPNPIVVAKEFATDDKLLALMVNKNILAPNESAIIHLIKVLD